ARETLGDETAIGLSVLQGEDYQDIVTVLDLSLFQYVELNWKYSFRNLPGKEVLARAGEIGADLDRFITTFHSLPRLIKFSRESLRFSNEEFFAQFLEVISQQSSGVIIANS